MWVRLLIRLILSDLEKLKPHLQQVVVLVVDALEVYDVHTRQIIERNDFNASSLVNPRLSHATNDAFQYAGSLLDVSHSMRVYKGKVFMLVRSFFYSVLSPS